MSAAPGRLPEHSSLDPEVARALEPYRLRDGRPMALFWALAHSRAALDDLRRSTAACLTAESLDPRTREIAILRICSRAQADAEWAIHVELFAAEAGLSEENLRATTASGTKGWLEQEVLVIRLADELHDSCSVSDTLWSELAQVFTPQQLVELLMVITQYHQVACLTNALSLPVPEGLPRPPVA